MSQNIDQPEDHTNIMLERLFDRKDTILRASQEIEDIRSEYRLKGCKDPDGNIEAEVFKRMYTIIACLSELSSYANTSSSLYSLVRFLVSVRHLRSQFEDREGESEGLHVLQYDSISAFCALANAVQIRWGTKKEARKSDHNIESIIKEFNLLKISPKLF